MRTASPIPLLALALALALAACSPKFDPASRVEALRILAVRAEPPELAPVADASAPHRAALAALAGHPAFATDPAREVVVLHVACTPDPGSAAATACLQFESLSSPTDLLAGADPTQACADPGTGRRGKITFSGLEACGVSGCHPITIRRDPADPASTVTLPAPAYAVPPDFSFDAYPADAPERVLGLEVDDLALALDAAPGELAPAAAVPDACSALGAFAQRMQQEWPAREHVLSLKRIRVRGPEAPSPPNQNPEISGITLGGAALPAPGATPAPVAARSVAGLLPVLPGPFASLRETYVRSDAAGKPIETRQEDWTFSWFATAGDVDRLHTKDPADADSYTAPGAGGVVVWSVVRDLRGGVAWTTGTVAVR